MTALSRRGLAICGALVLGLGSASRVSAQEQPELRIAAIVAVTGSASALGAPERNAIELFQKTWLPKAKLPVKVTVVQYDDASDPGKSVSLVRKAIDEDRVHVVICCTTTPSSLASVDTIRGLRRLIAATPLVHGMQLRSSQ